MDTPAAIVIKGDGLNTKSLFYFYPSFCFYPLLQKYHNILWYADVIGIFYV